MCEVGARRGRRRAFSTSWSPTTIATSPRRTSARPTTMSASDHPTSETTASPPPDRWADPEQPQPVEYPDRAATTRWRVRAIVWKRGTGKAAASKSKLVSDLMSAPTREAVLAKQQQYIEDFIHPKKRQKACVISKAGGGSSSGGTAASSSSGGGGEGGSGSSSSSSATLATRPRRAAAPEPGSLHVPPSHPGGPAPGHARAGPGRGHRYEPAREIAEQVAVLLPPEGADAKGTWLDRLRLRETWRTEQIRALEASDENTPLAVALRELLHHTPGVFASAGIDAHSRAAVLC